MYVLSSNWLAIDHARPISRFSLNREPSFRLAYTAPHTHKSKNPLVRNVKNKQNYLPYSWSGNRKKKTKTIDQQLTVHTTLFAQYVL